MSFSLALRFLLFSLKALFQEEKFSREVLEGFKGSTRSKAASSCFRYFRYHGCAHAGVALDGLGCLMPTQIYQHLHKYAFEVKHPLVSSVPINKYVTNWELANFPKHSLVQSLGI